MAPFPHPQRQPNGSVLQSVKTSEGFGANSQAKVGLDLSYNLAGEMPFGGMKTKTLL